MSSSTSSSEPATGDDGAGQALGWAAMTAVAVLLASVAFILATDPYDRGHWNLIGDKGVPEFGQPLRNAGIGRQKGYDAALVGNSTLQLVNPENVERIAGGKFVSMTMLGAGPLEELAMIDWFRANHGEQVRALAIGIDESWCQPAGPLRKGRPFPFWLYDRSPLAYLAGVIRLDSLRHGVVRIAVAAGRMQPMRPNGFEDYEPLLGWDRTIAQRAVERPRATAAFDAGTATFPALSLLEKLLGDLAGTTRVALVMLPRYASSIPAPGSNYHQLEAACRQRLSELVAGRSRTALLDMLADDAPARDIENWWDPTHYRGTIAREVERRIGTALAAMH